ncbi:MAG: HlyC/CorC family transporter [Spirochaetales bacterium]|nr:HlyC/CorC family transporter [Candidatus Physcosoma equi]
MTVGSTIVLQIILILINAFFAGTEIAVISLSQIQLKKNAEEGDKKAQKLLHMVENQSGFLSTIQIGITLAGFLGAAFSADVLSEHLVVILQKWGLPGSVSFLNSISVVIITIIISFFTLIFGELVPKRIAQQKAEGWSRMAVGIISALSTFFRPMVALLSWCTNLILKVLHMKTESNLEEVTEEDIRLMVDASGESGTIEEDEQEWIQNVFDFNDISIDDVMTRDADCHWIQENDVDEKILKTIRESGFSRFPVYGEDHDDIKGIILAREFLLNLTSKNRKPFKDIIRAPYLVPDSIHADKLFNDMQSHKVHMAIVIDEYGSFAGIITMEDLLEEIVGNIYDELDTQEELDVVKLEENKWRVTGDTLIAELNEETGLEVPESEDYDTVGGLVLSTLSTIPLDGTQFEVEIENLILRVLEVEEHRIMSVEVEKKESPEEEKKDEEEN